MHQSVWSASGCHHKQSVVNAHFLMQFSSGLNSPASFVTCTNCTTRPAFSRSRPKKRLCTDSASLHATISGMFNSVYIIMHAYVHCGLWTILIFVGYTIFSFLKCYARDSSITTATAEANRNQEQFEGALEVALLAEPVLSGFPQAWTLGSPIYNIWQGKSVDKYTMLIFTMWINLAPSCNKGF